MSTIDAYRHRLIGFIQCPMEYSLFGDGRVLDKLPVYELLEAIEGERSISGEPGDIVIGGGSGEASAMRFSLSQVFHHYGHTTLAPPGPPAEPIKSHWTLNETYIFAQGFAQLGWLPEQQALEIWLVDNLIAFLASNYPERTRTCSVTFRLARTGRSSKSPMRPNHSFKRTRLRRFALVKR